jgi:hypothetical protein
VLELADGKGAIADEGNRGKTIYRQVIGVVVVVILSLTVMVMVVIMVAITVVVIAVGMVFWLLFYGALAAMEILIGLKQANAENQGQGYLGPGGAQNPGPFLHLTDFYL